MSWSPTGFAEYRERFPATGELVLDGVADVTAGFIAAWERWAEPIARHSALWSVARRERTAVVFVRGYLGHHMPGNLVPGRDALRRSGWRATIVDNAAGGPIVDNVERVLDELARVPDGFEVVLCGHSRGGIEAWLAALRSPRVVRAVILSQTPRRRSWVLESVLLRRHPRGWSRRMREEVQRLGLVMLGAREGGLELAEIERHLGPLAGPWSSGARSYPVVQTASWSSRPTTWLDSFHERLSELRPGVAHDGQFYVEDLLWPGPGNVEHVLLPHLDHAQPAMDGFGFDSGRYWQTLIGWVLSKREA